jgi:eukaryotic-like serine/threonine-protein kinase
MKCLDENDAVAFMSGLMTPDAAASVETHTDTCHDCFALLSTLARLVPEVAATPRHASEIDAPSDRRPVARGATMGRYVVLDLLGTGGMGSVYAAYDPELNRRVALKLVRADPGASTNAADRTLRLLKEARAMARLAHPNVVTVHDVGTLEDRVFIAMEFVDGATLASWMKDRPRAWAEVVGVFAQAGRGLAAAHAAEIVHRDFKPDNVLVSIDGRVVVTDFGIARSTNSGADATTERPAPDAIGVTRTGTLLGTPAYMAPEQHRGEPADARADQFAFCVALYEALYGERPFRGSTIAELGEEIAHQRVRDPAKGSHVPSWLRRAVLRGLRVAPADRYPSMSELLQALERSPRKAWTGHVIALALVGAAALTAGLLLHARGERNRSCVRAEKGAQAAWNAAQKQVVKNAFLRTQKPYAMDAWLGVERTLDAYSRDWLEMHTEVCSAGGSENGSSLEMGTVRAMCLGSRSDELRLLTSVLANADDEITKNAFAAAKSLTPIGGCRDARGLVTRSPDASRDGTARDLRAKLVEAKVLGAAGKYADGRAIAERVVAAARDSRLRAIEAEALLQRGELELAGGDNKVSEQTFRLASYAADAARDDFTRAEAFTKLLWVQAYALGEHDKAAELSAQVSATLERVGGDDEIESHRAYALGMVLVVQKRFGDAEAELGHALTLGEKVYGADSRDVTMTLNGLGFLQQARGNYDAALVQFQRVLVTWQRLLGLEHPDVAIALNNVGVALSEQHRLDDAIGYYERALRVYERALGPEHLAVGSAAGNLGQAHTELGHHRQAIELLLRAVAIRERAFGPTHARLAVPLSSLGKAYAGLGDYARAVECLERAVRLVGESGDTSVRFESTFLLAKALWDSGADKPRACALVRSARDSVSKVSDGLSEESSTTADTWLSEHARQGCGVLARESH